MTISVIIPYLCKDEQTCRLLQEVKRQARNSSVKLDLVEIEGVSPCPKARNIALAKAQGDYIAWIDADDEITPNWWSSIVEALSSEPDIVIFPWFDEERNRVISYNDHGINDANSLLYAILHDDAPGSYLWNKVIRSKFWEEKVFDESYRLLTDFAIIPSIVRNVRTIKKLNVPLYHYRYTPKSVCREIFADRDRQLFEIMIRRVKEWEYSQFKDAPLRPLILQISYRLVKLQDQGIPPHLDSLISKAIALLDGRCLSILKCKDLWIGDKVRVLCAAKGYWRLFKIAHLIHKVFS